MSNKEEITFRMHEICQVTSSKRIYAYEYQNEGIPFYRGSEIVEKFNGALSVETEIFISSLKYETIKARFGVPKKGDVLLTSVGTIGIPYLVKEGEIFYFKDGNLTWFRDFKDDEGEFVYYWLQVRDGKAQLEKCTIGSSQKAYVIEKLQNMIITLPMKEKRQRIVEILSAYDKLILNNTTRMQILEQAIQLLFKEWFVFLRFPDYKRVKIVDGVPEGWGHIELDSLVNFDPKERLVRGKLVRYIPMSCLSEQGMTINLANSELRETPTGVKFRNEDILLAGITPCLENGKTGFVSCLDINETACGSTEFIVLRKKIFGEYYIYCLSRTDSFRGVAISSMIGTSGRQRVQTNVLRRQKVIVPPDKLLIKFNEIAATYFSQINKLSKINVELCEARDLLLPRLLNGVIEV